MLAATLSMLALACAVDATASPGTHVPAREGRHTVAPKRIMGRLFSVHSSYAIPGQAAHRAFHDLADCGDGRMSVRVGHGIEHADTAVTQVCAIAVSTLDHLDATLGRSRLKVELDLIASKTHATWRGQSLGFRPRIRLGAPMLGTREATVHNIVDLIAHEGFHVAAFVARRPDWSHEEHAYLFGLCTQFAVLGSLRRDSLPGFALPHGDDRVLVRSSMAAERVRTMVLPLFDTDEIKADSAAGRMVTSRCDALATAPARRAGRRAARSDQSAARVWKLPSTPITATPPRSRAENTYRPASVSPAAEVITSSPSSMA